MSKTPTDFEKRLIEAIVGQHSQWLGLNEVDLSRLEVLRREPTGVGCYVVFSRENQFPKKVAHSSELGFQGDILVHGVPSGLGAVLDIDEGQFNHLELFTYGSEEWDGNTSQGDIVPETI